MQRLGHGHTSFFAGEHPFNPLQDPTDIGSPPLRSSGLTVHLVQGKYWTRCQPLPTKGVHSPGLPDHPPCMSMRAQGLLIPKSPVEGRASLLHLQLSTCSLRRLKLANAPRPPSLSLITLGHPSSLLGPEVDRSPWSQHVLTSSLASTVLSTFPLVFDWWH